MLTKQLLVRMFLLWTLIAGVRIALTWGLTTGGLTPRAISALTLAFLPIILACEAIILTRSAREFLSKPAVPPKTWDFVNQPPSKSGLRSTRVLMGLLYFVLPYGLWIARLDAAATFPILAGCFMNLLWVSGLATILATHKRSGDQAKRAAASSSAT